MKSLQELANKFGTHDYCIESWVLSLNIVEAEIDFALAHFDKNQRRSIMTHSMRPAPYLKEHPELIEYVQRIGVDNIKALPQDVFEAHLKQLKIADSIDDEVNKRAYPYNSYDAHVFNSYRHATKKTDITFIERLYGRSISHHSYRAAMDKLRVLSRQLAPIENGERCGIVSL